MRLFCTGILLAILMLSGCRSTPADDGSPPSLELLINGPGIGTQRFVQPTQEDWPRPEFVIGQEYTAIIIGRDAGGIERVVLALPPRFEVLDLTTGALAGANDSWHSYTIVGERGQPSNHLFLSARFTVPVDAEGTDDLSSRTIVETVDYAGNRARLDLPGRLRP
jgi:hypothetical protein